MTQKPLGEPNLLTANEAKARLRCGLTTVYDLFRAGKLRGFRVGRRGVRIFAESIPAYIERNENREPAPQPKPARSVKTRRPVKTRRYEDLVPLQY